MGRQAILSHEKSVKHCKIMSSMAQQQPSISNYFKKLCSPKNTGPVASTSFVHQVIESVPSSSPSKLEPLSSTLDNFLTKDSVQQAEIIWAMKLVISHSSYNSFKDAGEIFVKMFADSSIAKNISIGSSKMAYVVTFGLAPYFHRLLLKEIGNSYFVVCIDEAMNRISQKGQMDLIVRYWPENSDQIQVRYLNSVFLGHSTAQDLFESFTEGTAELNMKNLLQISMDGPNVNHKFLRHLKQELYADKGINLLDLGTCSLHIIHGAFQTGNIATKWKLNEAFRGFYRLFKDSPARRADFISVTGSRAFPLKFCQVRWVENVSVAERALEIFQNVKLYISEMKHNLPNNFTVGSVDKICSDKLGMAKIAFFSSVAGFLQPFLKKFQSPKPLAPFLYESLSSLLRNVMYRFIRRDIINDAKLTTHLLQIDVSAKANHRKPNDIDIGIAARSYMKKCGSSDIEKNDFLLECKTFLIQMTKKIIEKCTVNFSFARSLSSLNPQLLLSNAVLCEKRMDNLLEFLVESNHLSAASADRAKLQFSAFTQKITTNWNERFAEYNDKNTRLDQFFSSFLSSDNEWKDIWQVMKIVFILSHGNASVESGFSINRDILVENLQDDSLVALRRTYDSIKSYGGVTSVPITAEMMQYVKMSRNRYHLALADKKKLEEKDMLIKREKKRMADQIKLLHHKKAKLSSEIDMQSKKIDEEISELQKNLGKK